MNLVILDRDGVINEDSDDFIKSPAEWVPLPGSLEAIAKLKAAGFTVAVATNQSGVARGLYSLDVLSAMHEKFASLLAEHGVKVDAIEFCPHGPNDRCACRKPLPGMYEAIAKRFGVGLEGVPVIGDSLRDLEAAVAVAAMPMLVKTGKGERTIKKGGIPAQTLVFSSLADAADHLINRIQHAPQP